MRRILLFILSVLFLSVNLIAQKALRVATTPNSVPNTGNIKYYYGNHNEPPRALQFDSHSVAASYFLANINRYLNVPVEFTFVEAEKNTDQLGMQHRMMRQYYKGIPVEGLEYRVHEKDGFVRSANGKAIRDIKVNTTTVISEEQAFHLAKKYLNTKDNTVRPGRKLIVSKGFTYAPESFAIAYQFDIDVSLIEQWRVSIDARTGQMLNKVSLTFTCGGHEKPGDPKQKPLPYGRGTGLSNYYGKRTLRVESYENGSSRLVGETENGGSIGTYSFGNVSLWAWIFNDYTVYNFYSQDNSYDEYESQKAGVSAHWAAEQAYEYYFQKHNRRSFDDNNSAIISYVHVDRDWQNAAWSRNRLLIGDGLNNNPVVDIDVIAHELTHGVTQYETQLTYYYEQGALNESFSDIFGKAVDFHAFGDTATWVLAPHFEDGGLRNMSDPNVKNQPDTYLGQMWYTGSDDNGGVHYNSGVQNFWFYLLCKGGTGTNDHGFNYSVNAIGMDEALRITYRNLTEYITSTSDYLDSRIGSTLAAEDLYGENSAIAQEVDKAWDAVGVIEEPIITDFELYDITATTVKVRGNFIPRADAATYHFEYGTTPSFGSTSEIYTFDGSVDGTIRGLQSSTKYYIRLVATNAKGNSYYGTTFVTLPLKPLVKIKQTVDFTETTAIFYGAVNPNSLQTSFHFEYGTTPALGLTTAAYPLNDTTEFLDVSAPVTGLQARQTYYYRLVATNSSGSATTSQLSFFTSLKPVITAFTPKAAPVGTEVTITGQHFNTTAAHNVVMFGATRAKVLTADATEIKVEVPSGASFGSLTVLDGETGLTTASAEEFVPTYTGEFNANSLQLRVGSAEYIYQALVSDMDGDYKPDIITSHYLGFSVYLNANNGGDITAESFVKNTFNHDFTPGNLLLADFDGNGLQDILCYYQGNLRVYPNLSVPGYVYFGPYIELPFGNMWRLICKDFDNDGRPDIAGVISSNYESSTFQIVRNQNTKGSLSAENFKLQYTKIIPYDAYILASTDVNNDGAADITVGSFIFQGDFASILINKSTPGVFDLEEVRTFDNTRERIVRYIGHDLNNDGTKDLIGHSSSLPGNLALFENTTANGASFKTPVIAFTGDSQSDVVAGDIDGDGKVDLIASTEQREFFFLKNKGNTGAPLSTTTFENFAAYGSHLENTGSGTVEMQTTISDLNGDGRPEVIQAIQYYYGPHDGYQFEIWQNAPNDCPDATQVKFEVTRNMATIILPLNTTFDQFEIDYAPVGYDFWWRAYDTKLYNLMGGYAYKVRIRAKCYLGFSGYKYLQFNTECVDLSNFSVTGIDVNTAQVYAYDLGSFEVQYSLAGSNDWIALPQYVNQITDLQPGTTYDIRFRGRCVISTDFHYLQFTTLCPKLSGLSINNITYNSATANWSIVGVSEPSIEYSVDNVHWVLATDTHNLYPLLSGTKYFVRGRLVCPNVVSEFTVTTFTTLCPRVSDLNAIDIEPFAATVTWTDASATGRYIVKYATAGTPTKTLETNDTMITITGLTAGTNYTCSVAPVCVASASQPYESISFSTICYKPYDINASDVTYTTARLSWRDDVGGLPYQIDYSAKNSKIWITKETTDTHLLLENLFPGTQYEARIHITCVSETAPFSAVLFTTALYDETTLHPNPTTGEVTIYPSRNLIGHRFVIFDNVGRVVGSGDLRDYTFDLSYLAPGIFSLKIEGEKLIRIFKQ